MKWKICVVLLRQSWLLKYYLDKEKYLETKKTEWLMWHKNLEMG